MGRKSKYSKEVKLSIVKRYLNGKGSIKSLARELNCGSSVLFRWIKKYQVFGINAFDTSCKNASYTKDFKERIILDYLNDGKSYDYLAIKYHILSSSTIIKWVKDYNSHVELKDYILGGEDIYMTNSRKITKEERIVIILLKLTNHSDYADQLFRYP